MMEHTPLKEAKDNAAFIVTACNNYERIRNENVRLRAALALYIELYKMPDRETDNAPLSYYWDCESQARAALGQGD